jgi:hypothetical protein
VQKALILVCLVGAAPSSQAADTVAVVAVDGCNQELSSGSARLLRGALVKQNGSQVQPEERTLSALGGPIRGSVQDAERLLASARLTFHDEFGSGGKTTKALDEATAIVMSLPPSEPKRWKTLCDVLSFQAQVYYMDNKPKAEAALEPILRVDPSFQVDRERYSPDMWKLTDKARKRLQSQTKGTLSVTTRPSMIPVYVNGRNMGKSPLTVDLPPGEYRVEALFGRERALARTVNLKDAVALELDHALDGSVRVESGPCLATNGTRGARLGALMRLAAYLGVNQTIGVWQEEPEKGEVYVVAATVDAGTGQQVREAKVKAIGGKAAPDVIEKLAQFMSKGDAPPPVEAVVTKPRPMPKENLALEDGGGANLFAQKKASDGISRKTWGLITGGTGLALVITGAVFDSMAYSAYKSEKDAAEAGDNTRLESYKSTAKSRGLTANVLYAAGAVGVGAGAYLYLTGRSPSTTVTVAPTRGGAVVAIGGRLP